MRPSAQLNAYRRAPAAERSCCAWAFDTARRTRTAPLRVVPVSAMEKTVPCATDNASHLNREGGLGSVRARTRLGAGTLARVRAGPATRARLLARPLRLGGVRLV